MYVYVYAYVYICMYVCMCVCIYVCMCMCVCMCVCVCMHACMYACMLLVFYNANNNYLVYNPGFTTCVPRELRETSQCKSWEQHGSKIRARPDINENQYSIELHKEFMNDM